MTSGEEHLLASLAKETSGRVADVGSWVGHSAIVLGKASCHRDLTVFEYGPTPDDFVVDRKLDRVTFRPTRLLTDFLDPQLTDDFGLCSVDDFNSSILPTLTYGVIKQLRENLQRHGLSYAKLIQGDFRQHAFDDHFDLVLADVVHTPFEAAANVDYLVRMVKMGGRLVCHDIHNQSPMGDHTVADVISAWMGPPVSIMDSMGVWVKTPWSLDLSAFDAVYCINMDSRPDRWNQCLAEFQRSGLTLDTVKRFPACVFGSDEESAAKGCLASHAAIVSQAKRRGLSNVLVLEDDVHFIFGHQPGPLPIQEEWDAYYLGALTNGPCTAVNSKLVRIERGWYATHAVGYHRSLFDEIMGWRNNHPRAIDGFLAECVQKRGKCFAPFPLCAIQRNSLTSIDHPHIHKNVMGALCLHLEANLRREILQANK